MKRSDPIVPVTPDIEHQQRQLCRRVGSVFLPPDPHAKVGIALNIREGVLPLNGLRHEPVAGTSGWYLWGGEEMSKAEDFFVPLHIAHVSDWELRLLKFLALAPGWRFLTDGSYEDVWYDATLIDGATRG